MDKGKVVILGSNGHLGHAAMAAFRDAGWDVTGFGRTNRKPVSGTRFVAGDGNDVAALRAAVAGADVVVNGLHLPYDKWGGGRAEAQLQKVLDALGDSGQTLMFPGTVYNYRADDRIISPDLRQSGEKPRGRIRITLERMLEEAAEAGRIRAIIVRAGDFFGPGGRGEWYEAAMMTDWRKGRIQHLGGLTTRHSWAYLPDLGRAFAMLAEKRNELTPFENFHFAGHWVTHCAIMDAIAAALPQSVTIKPFSWAMVRMVGLVIPLMRDLYEMRYLWLNEMELVDPRLDALLGPGFLTPFEAAVAATVHELTEAKAAA